METIPGKVSAEHCYVASIHGLEQFRLRLFAKADSVFPVLNKTVELRWPDGTVVRLQKGVGIGETKGHAASMSWARTGHYGVVLPIDGSAISMSYQGREIQLLAYGWAIPSRT